MHAKWKKSDRKKYAAQVLAVNNGKYKLFFLDSNVREDVPESELKGLTEKQKRDPLLNKRFYDIGNTSKTRRDSFKKGLFLVLARAIMKTPQMTEVCYWCERLEVGSSEREVILYGKYYVQKMLKKMVKK